MVGDPISRLAYTAVVVMLSFLVLMVVCMPSDLRATIIPGIKATVREVIDPHRRLLTALAVLFALSWIVGGLFGSVGKILNSRTLAMLSEYCTLLKWLTPFGALWILGETAKHQEAKKVGERLFGPKVMNNINQLNTHGGPVALTGHGSSIFQTSQGNTITVDQHLEPLMRDVEALPDGELNGVDKHEAIAELNSIADQCRRPSGRREPPKIMASVERVVTLLSSIGGLADKLSVLKNFVKPFLNG